MGVIRRQGITNTITTYIGIIIGFIYLIVISPRFLTKEELGLTRILFSFSLLTAMFVPIGIGNATTKYFPLFKNNETKHHGFFGFMLLFPILGFILTSGLLWLLRDFIMNQYRRESPLFLDFFNYVFPLIFFLSFINILGVYCSSHFKSTVPAFLNDVVVRILNIILITVYFMKWLTLDQFIGCYVGIYALQLLALITYIFIFDKPGFKIDWNYFREKKFINLIRYGMLLWFAGVASLGLKYFDSIMIAKFMPLGFVGIYTIAAFIPTVIEAPLNAIDKIAASRISYAWADNKHDEIYSIYHKSSLYMLLAGGFLFLNININIGSLFTFLPGDYSQGQWVVLIISIGTLFNMATGLNASILFNSDKYRYGAVYLICLAFMVFALQMLLIPRMGLEGAAIATSTSALIYNTLLTLTVWKFFRLQPFDKKNLKIAALIVGCFCLDLILPHLTNKYLDIAMHSTIISAVYVFVVYIIKVFPEMNNFFRWQR
jgi:O-antigen/teichoic acid export membrane protein